MSWINTAAVLRSPRTNEPMRPTLRSLIRDFCDRHGLTL